MTNGTPEIDVFTVARLIDDYYANVRPFERKFLVALIESSAKKTLADIPAPEFEAALVAYRNARSAALANLVRRVVRIRLGVGR